MATVPKPVAITAPTPTQAARVVGPSTRVASVSTSQVDQADIGTNIAFNAATSGFLQEQRQTPLNREEGRQQRFADPSFDRLFTTNTQIFAEIFEADSKAAASSGGEGAPSRSNKTPVSSVIKTYEDNALIISGRQHYNGIEFNFNL